MAPKKNAAPKKKKPKKSQKPVDDTESSRHSSEAAPDDDTQNDDEESDAPNDNLLVKLPWMDTTLSLDRALVTRMVIGFGGLACILLFTLIFRTLILGHSASSLMDNGAAAMEAVSAAGASAGASIINNQELRDFLHEVPPLGFAFAAATLMGFAMMFVRIKRRRDVRRTVRYWNGLKVTAIVASWISFMLVKTFYHFVSAGRIDDSAGGAAAVEKVVKTFFAATTLTGLVLTFLSRCCRRRSRHHGKKHHHQHHHLH